MQKILNGNVKKMKCGITVYYLFIVSQLARSEFCQKSSWIQPRVKVVYPKYSKHWLHTVAHTIDCVCSKMLYHGLNLGLSLSVFKLISCHIHWIAYRISYGCGNYSREETIQGWKLFVEIRYVLVYLNFILEF